jgi:surface antigen
MKTARLTIFLLTATIFLFSCAGISKEQSGQGLGSVVGAIVGYNLGKGHKDQGWAIGLGALYGAAIGANIGRSLDEQDKAMANKAFQASLENNETGTAVSWNNPDSGHSGGTTPTRTYTADSENPCREFTTTVLIGGEEQQGYGTACRQTDGSWKIIN